MNVQHFKKLNRYDNVEDAWVSVFFDRKTEKIFLTRSETHNVWRRNGGNWQRADTTEALRREIDEWLRTNFGHRSGEIWECDRYYYETEDQLPELGRGRSDWLKKFKCWPDEHGGRYETHGWSAHSGTNAIYIKCPNNDPEAGVRKAVILKMLFL